MTLEHLSLARGDLDRAAHLRGEGALDLAAVLPGADGAGPVARHVVVVCGGAFLVAGPAERPRLVLDAAPAAAAALLGADAPGTVPDTAPTGADLTAELVFLGLLGSRPVHALLVPGAGPAAELVPAGTLSPGARWAGLREVGALFDDDDAGLATAAAALERWHGTHRFCPGCGAPTVTSSAGWSRTCTGCQQEQFPRTDPAAIMAVVDEHDRLLLGRHASWPEGRFSTLAGFVEAGESIEAAVRREVLEEAGVVVGEVTYLGSQPWPFPRSLMLGFTCRARGTGPVVDGVELAEARWWTRDGFAHDVAEGTLLLPPPLSIAYRLIGHWYGAELPGHGTWRHRTV